MRFTVKILNDTTVKENKNYFLKKCTFKPHIFCIQKKKSFHVTSVSYLKKRSKVNCFGEVNDSISCFGRWHVTLTTNRCCKSYYILLTWDDFRNDRVAKDRRSNAVVLSLTTTNRNYDRHRPGPRKITAVNIMFYACRFVRHGIDFSLKKHHWEIIFGTAFLDPVFGIVLNI